MMEEGGEAKIKGQATKRDYNAMTFEEIKKAKAKDRLLKSKKKKAMPEDSKETGFAMLEWAGNPKAGDVRFDESSLTCRMVDQSDYQFTEEEINEEVQREDERCLAEIERLNKTSAYKRVD